MRAIIYIFIFCLTLFGRIESKAQTLVHSDFEMGTFHGWTDTLNWIPDAKYPIEGDYSARHNQFAISGESAIWCNTTPQKLEANGYQWQFMVRTGDFQLSDYENWAVIIAATDNNLKQLNAYAFGVNLDQPDGKLKLCRVIDGIVTAVVIDTGLKWSGNQYGNFRLQRKDGNWTIETRLGNEPDWKTSFSHNDCGISMQFSFAGVKFKHSSLHAGQIWFDNFVLQTSNQLPVIVKVYPLSDKSLKLIFNGDLKIDAQFLNAANYHLVDENQNEIPVYSVKKAAGDSLVVYLQTKIELEKQYTINLSNISDAKGQTFGNLPFSFTTGKNSSGAKVVINEIMADPYPTIALPDREYIELYNQGSDTINLSSLQLTLGDKLLSLPEVTFTPGKYVLIAGNGAAEELRKYGETIEIDKFNLRNDGFTLTMLSSGGQLIDQIEYLPNLHQSGKKEGGYSLERIDPERICDVTGNWCTTISPNGGTPGSINSVFARNADNQAPRIVSHTFENETDLTINFSEPIDRSIPSEQLIQLPIAIATYDSIRYLNNNTQLEIQFAPQTIENGNKNLITLHHFMDQCGNTMNDTTLYFGFTWPKKGDILINEILYNPQPNVAEFVELVNQGKFNYGFDEIFWATRNSRGELTNIKPLGDKSHLMQPDSYYAFTTDANSLTEHYHTRCDSCIILSPTLPKLADEGGTICLLNKNMEVIDEFTYNDSFHHPLVENSVGVSLERIALTDETQLANNWTSASKNSGGATPGYKNSAFATLSKQEEAVKIVQPLFSPNDDGFNDVLEIQFSSSKENQMVNIRIYNSFGIEIRRLANNLTIAKGETLIWDGRTEQQQKAALGIYAIQIEIFDQNGKSDNYKFACAITGRLH